MISSVMFSRFSPSMPTINLTPNTPSGDGKVKNPVISVSKAEPWALALAPVDRWDNSGCKPLAPGNFGLTPCVFEQ